MAKHHPDLIFCRKQPGVGKFIDTNNQLYVFIASCNFSFYLPSYRSFMWKMRRKMCYLRFICTSLHTCSYLWRMQLRLLSGSVCYLRRSRRLRRVLLQRVHYTRKRCTYFNFNIPRNPNICFSPYGAIHIQK